MAYGARESESVEGDGGGEGGRTMGGQGWGENYRKRRELLFLSATPSLLRLFVPSLGMPS